MSDRDILPHIGRAHTSAPSLVCTLCVGQRLTPVSPLLVRPGQIFVMDFGGGAGQTGMVRGIRGARSGR